MEKVGKFRKKLAVDLYNMSNRNRIPASTDVRTEINTDDVRMIDESFTYPLKAFTTVFQGNVEEADKAMGLCT
ncbi:unnamed protein product [Urochloa humidicola]